LATEPEVDFQFTDCCDWHADCEDVSFGKYWMQELFYELNFHKLPYLLCSVLEICACCQGWGAYLLPSPITYGSILLLAPLVWLHSHTKKGHPESLFYNPPVTWPNFHPMHFLSWKRILDLLVEKRVPSPKGIILW
jgi:hypothetical protein